jgi:hypothetical protein
MKYSVWNNGTRSYDYYEAPGTSDIHAGAPPRVHGSALGATIDQAAWKLPGAARRMGSGEFPEGRIASLGGADSGGGVMNMIIYGALAYGAWRLLR